MEARQTVKIFVEENHILNKAENIGEIPVENRNLKVTLKFLF